MEKDLQLLNKIYKGTHIGSRSLNTMLCGVNNKHLRQAIITQINEYDKINTDAKFHIAALGKTPKKPTMTAMSASIEAKMNLAADPSPSHVAETIIKGSNMGIINITKELNRARLCSPSVYDLGRKLVKTEENNVARIKAFL